jgi:hypothetical protein
MVKPSMRTANFSSINAAADWKRGEDMNGRKERQLYTRNTGVGPFHLYAEGFRLFLFQTKRRNGVYRKIKKQSSKPKCRSFSPQDVWESRLETKVQKRIKQAFLAM